MAVEFSAPIATAVNIVVGHYGVGKTNFSINWALDLARAGRNVTLIDIDIVNPYFRSSDYTSLLEAEGVNVIAPVMAGTALDNPSLSGAIATIIENAYAHKCECEAPVVIIDVGGDDVGATALGRFARAISSDDYQMFYVVNKYRNLTQDAASALEILREVEGKSDLRATGVVNNSHLRELTDEETVLSAFTFGQECADGAGVPLVCTTAPESVREWKLFRSSLVDSQAKIYPVKMYVSTPWE